MKSPTIVAWQHCDFTQAQPSARGSVELSNNISVPQNPSLPKLNLTNMQREQIRKAVLTERNEVEFRLKATKAAKDFTPVVGSKKELRPNRCQRRFWRKYRISVTTCM